MIAVPIASVIARYIIGRSTERWWGTAAGFLDTIASLDNRRGLGEHFLRQRGELLLAAMTLAGTLALFLVF
jgi:hypothetical protein